MNKCIQFKIGEKVFKFDGILMEDSLGKIVSPTIRNLITLISKSPNHKELLMLLLLVLETQLDKQLDLDYNSTAEYADNIVGEITPMELVLGYTNLGAGNEDFRKLASLLSSGSDPIIKLASGLLKPSILLGNKRSVILTTLDLLASGHMLNAFMYLYLDNKSKDSSSPIYKTLLLLLSEIKESSLNSELRMTKLIVEELSLLDSVNANKRLLAYIFNPSFYLENIALLDGYKDILNLKVYLALKLRNIYSSTLSNLELYKILPLLENDTSIAFSDNVTITIKQLRELLFLYRDLNFSMTYADIIKNLVNTEGWGEFLASQGVITDINSSDLVTKFMESLLAKISPNNTYDASVFKGIRPSDVWFMYLNLSLFTDLLSVDLVDKLFKVLEYIRDLLINNASSELVEIGLKLDKLKVLVDDKLFVTPSRKIEFNTANWNPASGALTLKYDSRIKSAYKVDRGLLKINPNKDLEFKREDFKGISSIYIPNNMEYSRTSNILSTLKELTGIRFMRTQGYGPESVRLSHDAINMGMNVTVYVPGDYKYDDDIEPSILGFVERFLFITPIPPSSLNPKLKFYTANTSHLREFSNKKGHNNLNPTLGIMEKDLNTNLDLFDLLKKGIIEAVIVNSNSFDILSHRDGDIVDIYNKDVEDDHLKFTINGRYNIDGEARYKEAPLIEIGSVWSNGDITAMITSISEDSYLTMVLNKFPNLLLPLLISKDDFKNYNNYRGSYPTNSLYINIKNLYLFRIGTESFLDITDDLLALIDFHISTLELVSLDTGFSVEFLANKVFNTSGSFNKKTIVLLSSTDLEDDVPVDPIPNFNGKLFAIRLTERLNTPIHFITSNLFIGMGFLPSKGLIYNGEIYMNTDSLDSATPFHELTHLILAYIKENNYLGYLDLLETLDTNDPLLVLISKLYPELTNLDRLEELLAEKIGNSFATLFEDPDIDSKLLSLNIDTVLSELLESDLLLDFRTVMQTAIKSLTRQSESLSRDFASIFPKGNQLAWNRISSIKSRLKASQDVNNKLEERC